MDIKESSSITINSIYIIDVNTILEDIKNRNSNIFILQTNSSEKPTESPNITWQKDEFFVVAEELNLFVKQESLETLHLNEIQYMTDCSKVLSGYQRIKFKYYKTDETNDSRLELSLFINPELGEIDVFEIVSSPNLTELQTIYPNNFIFSVDEAIQIAEKNGGFEKRQKMSNDCYISARIVGGGTYYRGFAYDGWVISYLSSNSQNEHLEFYIKVNPQTGDYKIIEPNGRYPNLWETFFPPDPQ